MRKVWNRPNLPVWSLVTTDTSGQYNMNICTYVTSVSMEPKLQLVAVYNGTKTLANIQANPTAPILLQLLSEELAPVVRVCGQQSGLQIDKIARLQKRYDIAYRDGLPYFSRAAGIMYLLPQALHDCGGDHQLLVGTVAWSQNLYDLPLLTTDYLKDNKFTR
jgi:flavin reductase (DIM6/NTAB) family NADH-FMN oxidoreductase RutF